MTTGLTLKRLQSLMIGRKTNNQTITQETAQFTRENCWSDWTKTNDENLIL